MRGRADEPTLRVMEDRDLLRHEILRRRLELALARHEEVPAHRSEQAPSIEELDELSARRAATLAIIARAMRLDGLLPA
jgi:hypothetical protein